MEKTSVFIALESQRCLNLITRTREKRNRGGVGLFIKEDVNFNIRKDFSVFIPHIFE